MLQKHLLVKVGCDIGLVLHLLLLPVRVQVRHELRRLPIEFILQLDLILRSVRDRGA